MRRSSVIDQAAAKQALRQEMRSRRKAMPQAEKVSREQRLCRRFLESSLYADCRQLFCFVALPQEPETRELLRRALADGKTVAVPRCLPERRMAFHRLSPEQPLESQLVSGSFGVAEPLDLAGCRTSAALPGAGTCFRSKRRQTGLRCRLL